MKTIYYYQSFVGLEKALENITDIDVIIVADYKKYPRTSKNPKHAFAFKTVLDDQIVESKVVDVIWSPSKD